LHEGAVLSLRNIPAYGGSGSDSVVRFGRAARQLHPHFETKSEPLPIYWSGRQIGSLIVLRVLFVLKVLCCDPLAIALTARGFGPAINHRLKLRLIRSTFDSRRADAIEGSQRIRARTGHLGQPHLAHVSYFQTMLGCCRVLTLKEGNCSVPSP
jgi:hypothetical protein